MKKSIPPASPAAYVASMSGWQQRYVEALRAAVTAAAPELEELVKWGHLVYFSNGPVLLIRAEAERVLFGFWRGQRLQTVEPRLRSGGKHEMATLALTQATPLTRAVVMRLAVEATALNAALGNPTRAS